MSCIDPVNLRQADEIERRFVAAQPFRHVVIPDFLDRSLCEKLLADFPRFEDRHALNEMGEVGGKAVRMDVRDISESYRVLDRYLQTAEFLDFVSRATGIPDLLYDPDYIGGGTHENRDGQSLDAHVDFNYHPRTRWHRRLNLIVYLNPHWAAAWGGMLELHSDPWNAAADHAVGIAPAFNTCAIFETTEASWHGFSQIRLPADSAHLSRKSFAIYLYTRERPAAQTAPPHATIYVPEVMPSHLRGGYTLGDADVRELTGRFSRLRTQLRYLYDREKHFGAQIDALERALGEARSAQRLELQGYATQPAGVQGLWPDGWAGAEMSMRLMPTRAAKGLRLELWSPPQLGNEQELRIELGGQTFSQALRPGMRTPVSLRLQARAGEEVGLSIRAAHTWIPGAASDSGDRRALAYRIVSASLEH
ncbi:2OG-Fe(II) oxygenase [Dokdonella soli]|uniref:Prolyl 4-hydroxylase alpha subunit Fe(2+) 2OG dioxygenase domain-containing protein n=1 Tax=Dokdonella soli TaxID=529810 RepID=A0ABN1II52_9GAMM